MKLASILIARFMPDLVILDFQSASMDERLIAKYYQLAPEQL